MQPPEKKNNKSIRMPRVRKSARSRARKKSLSVGTVDLDNYCVGCGIDLRLPGVDSIKNYCSDCVVVSDYARVIFKR